MKEGDPETQEIKVSQERIKDIANAAISSLDPIMSAIIKERIVTLPSGEEYLDTMLYFTHPSDSSMEWTMEMNNDTEYVEGRLSDIVRQVHERKAENKTLPETNDVETIKSLSRIKNIANQTITSLDPMMSAIISDRVVRPFSGEGEYDATLLYFTHPTDPSMEWTMDIERDPEYVEGKLADVIRNVFERKKQKKEELKEDTDEAARKMLEDAGRAKQTQADEARQIEEMQQKLNETYDRKEQNFSPEQDVEVSAEQLSEENVSEEILGFNETSAPGMYENTESEIGSAPDQVMETMGLGGVSNEATTNQPSQGMGNEGGGGTPTQ